MNEIEVKAGLAKTPGYRYASISGDQIHVAGQVPQDSSGQICDIDDPYGQATRCLRNLELLLACHDFAMSDIRHLTAYVVGARENLTTAWKAVLNYFLDEVPPATLIGVSLLGYEDQLVEIDAIIVRKPSGAYKGRCRPTLSANVGRLDREVGPSVVKVAENAEREQRIIYEVVVDAYGPEERALGWFYYAEERMSFPFQGRCTTTRSISPLKESEEVVVLGLAEEDECMNELFVRVEWQGRDLAVPLSQLVSIDGDVDTEQVIEDWRYWNHRGYIY